MENNTTPMDAAKIIKKYCESIGYGGDCLFSEHDQCTGAKDCLLIGYGYAPSEWEFL